MTRPDAPARRAAPLQSFWARALASLLLSLAGLVLGWQLSEQGHARLAAASQTSPALPELRPLPSPQPGVQGVGAAPEGFVAALRPGWAPVLLRPAPQARGAAPDLAILGRMNLDGG